MLFHLGNEKSKFNTGFYTNESNKKLFECIQVGALVYWPTLRVKYQRLWAA
jgi:hypothetical protein